MRIYLCTISVRTCVNLMFAFIYASRSVCVFVLVSTCVGWGDDPNSRSISPWLRLLCQASRTALRHLILTSNGSLDPDVSLFLSSGLFLIKARKIPKG